MIQIKYVRKLLNEEQIRYWINKSDEVLYLALKELYNCQTEEEKFVGNTSEHNGIGFNPYDAPFLSAMVVSLNQYGHLTKGQKEKTRPMILKYSKQLTNIANDKKFNKEVMVNV